MRAANFTFQNKVLSSTSSVEAHITAYVIFWDGFGVIALSCAPRRELSNGPLFDLWGSKLAEI